MSNTSNETNKRWLDAQYDSADQIKKPDELENNLTPPSQDVDSKILNRIHGSIAGMALGDALGAHVEFRPRKFLVKNPVEDLKGGGTWGLNKGEFTDDTSMALCLASSLIICKDFIPYDQLVRYKWWFRNGYMSATGKCFDIGAATKRSLLEFERRQREFGKKHNISMKDIDYVSDYSLLQQFDVDCSEKEVAGNGALMRLAPVPLFFYRHPKYAVEYAGTSGRITHGDQSAYDACRYYGALIVAALHGASKDDLLDNDFYKKNISWFNKKPLHDDIMKIAKGSYKKKGGYDDGIRGRGYIVDALEAALWAFWSDKDSFEKGVLAAVNLGDDTDTTAAIYGQLAGAYYGFGHLPPKWLEHMYAKKFIECLSKWIVYEGQKWQPHTSRASIIDIPVTQLQFNTRSSLNTEQTTNFSTLTTKSQSNSHNSNELLSKNQRGSGLTAQSVNESKRRSQQNNNLPSNTTFIHGNEASATSRKQSVNNNKQCSVWPTTNDRNHGSYPTDSAQHWSPTASPNPSYATEGLQSCDDVCHWLEQLGEDYKTYIPNFMDNMVDGFWLLNYVNDAILTHYGVRTLAHRQMILEQIEAIKNECVRKRSAKN